MLVRCLLPMCPHTSFLITPRRLCLLLPPLLLLLIIIFRPTHLLCLESEGGSAMATVCRQVEQGLALGDLCRQLCTTPSSVLPTGCQKRHGGKSIVFHATFHGGQDVVVKARTLDLETEAQGSVHYSDEAGAQVFPGVEEFTAMVVSHLSLNMNLTIGDKISIRTSP